MKKALQHWFRGSWLSCEQFAERESKALDAPLPLMERLGHLFHFAICFTCRRVSQHLHVMNSEIVKLDSEHTHDTSLPSASAERMKEALRRATK